MSAAKAHGIQDFDPLLRNATPSTGIAPALRATTRSPDAGAGDPATAPFGSVTVLDCFSTARPAWSHLLRIAQASPYQRQDWIEAWAATEGVAEGLTPMIVVAHHANGDAVALLPLGLRRTGWLRTATFLGGRQTNYNMGLFDPRLLWTGADAEQLLRAAGKAVPGGVDLFTLFNQPEQWNGFANPLARLRGSQSSPSPSHRAVLEPDAEAFLKAHQSGAARKKLRAKAGQLAAIGPVRHITADTPAMVDAVIATHVAQKAAKLATLGIASPDKGRSHRLLARAATADGASPAPLELHALVCGDTMVATFGGLAHGGRFSGTLISHTSEPAFARCSPGELLLMAVIRSKCAAGYAGFDLGVGEARYKDSLCPVADPLVDGFLPLTARAQVFAFAGTVKQRAKTAVKRSPRMWALVQKARRVRALWHGA